MAPQHTSDPSATVAHDAEPTANSRLAVATPAAAVGDSKFSLRPKWIRPQHVTDSSWSSADACAGPSAMSLTPASFTCTGTGESVVVPLPRWPSLLRPQHHTVSSVSSAHVT